MCSDWLVKIGFSSENFALFKVEGFFFNVLKEMLVVDRFTCSYSQTK